MSPARSYTGSFVRCGLGYGCGMGRREEDWPCKQERVDLLVRLDSRPGLDPAQLVFIDETWAKTDMMSTHGHRLPTAPPHGHWKTSTFVAGLTLRGMIASFGLDGPIDRRAFETHVEKVLGPRATLRQYRHQGLWAAAGMTLETFAPDECKNYFNAVGHDPG